MPHGVLGNDRAEAGGGDARLIRSALEDVFRREYGRILAFLVGWSGSFDRAEDALQEALLAAVEAWKTEVPRNPGAWLTTVGRNRLISRLRREREVSVDPSGLTRMPGPEAAPLGEEEYPDERLKLMFMCCHPALPEEQRLALTLHTLGGLSTAEIADAFLVPTSTMAQRIVRAKRKIAEAGIRFQVPPVSSWEDRLDGVLRVLYLIFTEGYASTRQTRLIREDLCQEALRLARIVDQLLHQEASRIGAVSDAEVQGLLALMILHEARRPARVGPEGIVLLENQDRSLWNPELLSEGRRRLDQALGQHRPGPFQIQAAIVQLHCEAESADQTDWVQIVGLYAQLLRWEDTPVVRLNAAVALAQVVGPGAALEQLAPLKDTLTGYQPFHLVRAQLLEGLGHHTEAGLEYEYGLALTHNLVERRAIEERIRALSPRS